jgi:hypothetical protein
MYFWLFLVESVNLQSSEQSRGPYAHIGYLVPLVILGVAFLLSVCIIIYQRRLIQTTNRQSGQELVEPGNTTQKQDIGKTFKYSFYKHLKIHLHVSK